MSLAERQVILEHRKNLLPETAKGYSRGWGTSWVPQPWWLLMSTAAVTSGLQCLGHSCPYQSLSSSVSLWASYSLLPVFWFRHSFFFLFRRVPWTVRQMTQISPLGWSMLQSLILSSLTSYESMQSPLLTVKWGFAHGGWEQIHGTWRGSPLCSRHRILLENWWTLVQSWHYYRSALILPASSVLLLEGFIARLIYKCPFLPHQQNTQHPQH